MRQLSVFNDVGIKCYFSTTAWDEWGLCQLNRAGCLTLWMSDVFLCCSSSVLVFLKASSLLFMPQDGEKAEPTSGCYQTSLLNCVTQVRWSEPMRRKGKWKKMKCAVVGLVAAGAPGGTFLGKPKTEVLESSTRWRSTLSRDFSSLLHSARRSDGGLASSLGICVLRGNHFLFGGITKSDVNSYVILRENSSTFLSHVVPTRNDNVVGFLVIKCEE